MLESYHVIHRLDVRDGVYQGIWIFADDIIEF